MAEAKGVKKKIEKIEDMKKIEEKKTKQIQTKKLKTKQAQTRLLCFICGNPAILTCRLCGRPVCAEHQKDGVCVVCRRGRFIKS